MYKLFFSVLFIFQSINLYSQDLFDFSGYIAEIPYYSRTNELISVFSSSKRDQFYNLTRVRLRPTYNFLSNAKLALEYEVSSVYLSSPMFFNSQPDKTNRQIIDLNWNLVNNEHFITSHFIDRLYLKYNFEHGSATLGRQRISWGTGRIWNPTDLFNPISPTNFGKIEKDGADALSAVFNLASFTDLSLVFNPQEKIGDCNSAFRFRTNFSEYDVSLIGGYFDRRIVIGSDFAGNFFNAGLRGEGIISADNENFRSNFVKYILGIDYQFTGRLYCLLEYQYNGEGHIETSSYELTRLIKGEILNLNKNYLYVLSSYLLHPLINLNLSFCSNLNDGSGFFSLAAGYSSGDNSSISLGGQIFYGENLDEYWYYPNSIYLKADFYF